MYGNDMYDVRVSDVCSFPGVYFCTHAENSWYGHMYGNDMYDIHMGDVCSCPGAYLCTHVQNC